MRLLVAMHYWKWMYHINSEESNTTGVLMSPFVLESSSFFRCNLSQYCATHGFPTLDPWKKFPMRPVEPLGECEIEEKSATGIPAEEELAKAQARSQRQRQGGIPCRTHLLMDKNFGNLCAKRSIGKENPEYDESLVVTQFHASFSNVKPNQLHNGSVGAAEKTVGKMVVRLDPTMTVKVARDLVNIVSLAFGCAAELFDTEAESQPFRRSVGKRVRSETAGDCDVMFVSSHSEFIKAAYGTRTSTPLLFECQPKNACDASAREKADKPSNSANSIDSGAKDGDKNTKERQVPTLIESKLTGLDESTKKRQATASIESKPTQTEDSQPPKKLKRSDSSKKEKCCKCCKPCKNTYHCRYCGDRRVHNGCSKTIQCADAHRACNKCINKRGKVVGKCDLGDDCLCPDASMMDLVKCECGTYAHNQRCSIPIKPGCVVCQKCFQKGLEKGVWASSSKS
jgi:hypothetical protein